MLRTKGRVSGAVRRRTRGNRERERGGCGPESDHAPDASRRVGNRRPGPREGLPYFFPALARRVPPPNSKAPCIMVEWPGVVQKNT